MLSIRDLFQTVLILATLQAGAAAQAQQAVDPDYHGSSFNEVMSVVESKSFSGQNSDDLQEFEYYKDGFPQYQVNFLSLGGALFNPLFSRSKKTLAERADYYDHFKKYVHANGVCVAGKWQISARTAYTGFFKKGASGLFIGRISVALADTTNADRRGFGFAGKIFPTMNPNDVVETTSFFTVDVLSGTKAQRFLEQPLTNEPPLIPSVALAAQLSKIVPAFLAADSSPTFRPVTQIARIGSNDAVASPIWVRLRAAPSTIKNDEPDFRDEVITALEDNHALTFLIEVSSTTKDRLATAGWTQVGTITADQAMVTYGCDRRLHFSHPKDDKSNKVTKN